MNDFSRFISAVQQDDTLGMERYASKIRQVILNFLIIQFGVPHDDAEDCAQNIIVMMITKTREGKLLPDQPPAYVFVSARNEYFRLYKLNKRNSSMPDDDFIQSTLADPGQALIDSELKEILYYCIEQLNAAYKKLVLSMLEDPDQKAEKLAKELNTTANNIWIRKHRVNKKLLECIEKKS